MKMTPSDIATYPNFAAYVRYKIPELINVGSVIKNLGLFGSLTAAEARHALRWGNNPEIVITDLGSGQCGGGGGANGCFRDRVPNKIEIHIARVKHFESGSGKSTDSTSTKQTVYIIGTTLLHELCHWGNFGHGVSEAGKPEQGKEFEKATYGRDTGQTI